MFWSLVTKVQHQVLMLPLCPYLRKVVMLPLHICIHVSRSCPYKCHALVYIQWPDMHPILCTKGQCPLECVIFFTISYMFPVKECLYHFLYSSAEITDSCKIKPVGRLTMLLHYKIAASQHSTYVFTPLMLRLIVTPWKNVNLTWCDRSKDNQTNLS